MKNDCAYVVMITYQDVRYSMGLPGTYVAITHEYYDSYSDRKFPSITFYRELRMAHMFPTREIAINYMNEHTFDTNHYKVLKLSVVNEE